MAKLKFRFDARRGAEAASRFAELAGGTIELVRLVKMLYLAERRSLERFHHPMFGDSYVSMEHGPVVSHAYNLLKDDPAAVPREKPSAVELWGLHFVRDGYRIRLQHRVPPSALSRADLQVIQEVHEEWSGTGTWDMVKKLHSTLEEWQDPGKSSTPISVENLCAALHLKDADLQELRDHVRADMAMDKVLQG